MIKNDEWDRIAKLAHTSTEGVLINRAKAKGKIIAFKHVIEMFEGKDEEVDAGFFVCNNKPRNRSRGCERKPIKVQLGNARANSR